MLLVDLFESYDDTRTCERQTGKNLPSLFYYIYQNTLHNLNKRKATNSSANTQLTVLELERRIHKKYKVNEL
jgi:hypothetical protein